jgi:alkyl hydroperoxide reductase subunit AhpC
MAEIYVLQGPANSGKSSTINEFEQHNCEIIFCAARTRGMTVQWINSHSQKYHINFIQQTIVENNKQQQARRNQTVAQNIISKAGL